MTRKNLDKIKSVLILMLIVLISFSLLLVSACSSSDDSTDSEKTYTKVEKDEQELTNGNFEFGTADVKISDFPYTSISGWSKSTDNSATSSKVNSGIIKTSEKDFSSILDNLISNSTFKEWALKKFNIDKDEEKTKLETENPGDDSEKIAEKLEAKITELIKQNFSNPSTPDGVTGSKILMLNNYLDSSNVIGTAQKVSSSKTFTLKANTYAKFSVSVKTAFLTNTRGGNYGANIRLTNTVSGVTQDEYRVSNIIADEWTKYTIYVKSNDFADSTVKLTLGLGYGAGNSNLTYDYVEGTAYFDEASYEEIEENDYISALSSNTADKLNLVSTSSSLNIEATNYSQECFLDLTSTDYYNILNKNDIDFTDKLTTSNKDTSGMPSDASKKIEYPDSNSFKATVKNASYTININEDNPFSISSESYMAISFTVSMDLSTLARSGLTLYVVDTDGNETNYNKTLDNVIIEKDTSYTIIIKNNFDKDIYTQPKKFYLSFIIGPVDVAAQTDPTFYSTGTVTIKDIKYTMGSLDKETYDEDNLTPSDSNNIYFYNVYSLITKTVDSSKVFSTALYAGFSSDYSKEDDNENYSFKVAYSDEGRINSKPANVANYIGFADYKATYTESHNNENAGLVNTKYIANYETDILDALDDIYDSENNIQPLIINNKTADSYGFASETKTISADSFATVSVKVRVTGNATAYIYLVNTKKGDNLLKTLTQEFKADNGIEYSNSLYVKVTSADMEDDGWVTVNFYVASGKDSMSYRLEMWNGQRKTGNETAVSSTGIVFFNDVSFGTSFTEADILSDAFKNATITSENEVKYTRQLDEDEIEFNKNVDSTDDLISYKPKTVWASNTDENNHGTFVYAIFNTINPTAINPNTTTEDDSSSSSGSGCTKVNSSTFWLSFSSILLGVALVAAMIMLIVKKVRARHEKNKNDAKVHYKVSSRNKAHSEIKAKAKKVTSDFDDEENDDSLDNQDDTAKETKNEETSDTTQEEEKEEYKYGEVLEDFGSNDDNTEENKDNVDNTNKDKE